MTWVSRLSIFTVLISFFVISGCQKSTSSSQDHRSAQAQPVKTLSIGFQKSSLNFLVARQQKLFEQAFPQANIVWREFPAGPQMLEALSLGAVDFGAVGNTPPIFAQAAGKQLQYVAYENVAANAQALIIHRQSAIKTLADLKHKRIAVQKGSSAHDLLAKILQKANLSWTDIQPIWLAPAEARAAFDKQAIDAWVIWEPYLGTAELQDNSKVLIDGTSFPSTYAFYISNPVFLAQHADAGEKLIQVLNQADQWIIAHPEEAQQIYIQSTGLDARVVRQVLQKRPKPSPTQVLTAPVIQSQQEIADAFQRTHLIPSTINIQQRVWSPH